MKGDYIFHVTRKGILVFDRNNRAVPVWKFPKEMRMKDFKREIRLFDKKFGEQLSRQSREQSDKQYSLERRRKLRLI